MSNQATGKRARTARAAKKLDATQLQSGDWAHYDDGMRAWFVVTANELEEFCDYLDSDDEQIASDAYSHWCAGTVTREATAEEVAEVTGEPARETGELRGATSL